MKLLSVLLLPSLALLTGASIHEAYIYTHDVHSRSSSSRPDTVSSETAYAIWQRRLALSEDRPLSSLGDSALETIDRFGGQQPLLFGDAQAQTKLRRLSIVLEGFDDGVAGLDRTPDLIVANPSQEFIHGVRGNSLSSGESDAYEWSFQTADNIQVHLELGFAEPCDEACQSSLSSILASRDDATAHWPLVMSILDLAQSPAAALKANTAILHLDYTQMTASATSKKCELIANLLSNLSTQLAKLSTSGTQGSTIIVLPTTSKSLPSKSKSKSKSKHQARQLATEEGEEPLSIPSDPLLSIIAPQQSSTNTTPPTLGPGKFLPACFTSLSDCSNATNACSGHGACSLKHRGCYACKCSSTIVRYNDDGTTKSVQWGGAACEKKDVSVQFFLFASFGVAMAALISGVIGMMYSMGAQELPSVIGAGVAGPRATR